MAIRKITHINLVGGSSKVSKSSKSSKGKKGGRKKVAAKPGKGKGGR